MKKRNPRSSKKTGHFERCVEGVKRSGSAYDPEAVCAAQERRMGLMNPRRRGRRNPAQESVDAYREFHGRDPDELITIEEKIHYHKYLPAAGPLEWIVVKPINPDEATAIVDGVVNLTFSDCFLCFSEKGNQLFARGGDQSVDPAWFGITGTIHEVETLGRVKRLGYFTRKDHLGKDGGIATYDHQFKTVSENGKIVKLRILRYPDLIYYTRDERLVFSGGSYKITREGIDK
jgi:hypothetical protein